MKSKMKKFIKFTFFALLTIVSIIFFTFPDIIYEQVKKVNVSDKIEKIVLHKKDSQEYIHTIHIRITGNIDGTAKVLLLLDGSNIDVDSIILKKPDFNISVLSFEPKILQKQIKNKIYRSIIIKNSFSVKLGGDWYSDSAVLIYKPITAHKGKIKIEYTFVD